LTLKEKKNIIEAGKTLQFKEGKFIITPVYKISKCKNRIYSSKSVDNYNEGHKI